MAHPILTRYLSSFCRSRWRDRAGPIKKNNEKYNRLNLSESAPLSLFLSFSLAFLKQRTNFSAGIWLD